MESDELKEEVDYLFRQVRRCERWIASYQRKIEDAMERLEGLERARLQYGRDLSDAQWRYQKAMEREQLEECDY
jgi:chromosome segregation ATPase